MNTEIQTSLQELGVPYSYLEHSGQDETYVVYSDYDGQPLAFGDNKELYETLYYQFDIFSTSNLEQVEARLKELLFLLGGTRLSQFSNYEDGYYQKSIRFRFDRKTGGN